MLLPMRPCLPLSLPMIVALGHVAHGDPKPPRFTGEKKLAVTVTAAYGTAYAANTFRPTLKVAMAEAGPHGRTVTITDEQYAVKYQCPLNARLQGARLSLDLSRPCKVAIATPDFCVLTDDQCARGEGADRLKPRRCADEKDHLGELTATLTAGSVIQDRGGAWKLSVDLAVNACVLVQGYNKNLPVQIRGGAISVRTP